MEAEKDYRAVAELTRGAFGNVYKPGADGHYYVRIMQFHPGFIPDLAFVLEKDGRIIGNIICTKVWQKDKTEGGKRAPFLWSPCVVPEYQRQKPDRVLIKHSFDVARKMGYDVKINFGNPGNYVSCKRKSF